MYNYSSYDYIYVYELYIYIALERIEILYKTICHLFMIL